MVADVWNFHLLGDVWIFPFQTYNNASLSDGMSYHPRVGTIQESTSGLVITVASHYVSDDFPKYLLHRYVRFHEKSTPSVYFGPSSQIVLPVQ